jgi:prepilin-type N-terminal cleavage/methylation domain-containing protein
MNPYRHEDAFQRSKGPRNRGFSLVELMVVISILAILSAILFPVFAGAKDKALRVASMNNLRQLATAALLYTNDNADYLPPYINDENVLSVRDPDVTTHGVPTDSKYPTLLKSAVGAYLHDDAIWFCPTDPFKGQFVANGYVDHKYSSYRYWPQARQIYLNRWPPVIPASGMRPNEDLFAEVTWFEAKTLRSYWRQPTWQSVAIDGHLIVSRESPGVYMPGGPPEG